MHATTVARTTGQVLTFHFNRTALKFWSFTNFTQFICTSPKLCPSLHSWDHLEAALDRFAQFFISPTISQDGVEREVKAVDSECVSPAILCPSFICKGLIVFLWFCMRCLIRQIFLMQSSLLERIERHNMVATFPGENTVSSPALYSCA